MTRKKFCYALIQLIFFTIIAFLIVGLRVNFGVDIGKDIYPLISIFVVIVVLALGLGFKVGSIVISLFVSFICAYFSSELNYYLTHDAYYLFNFNDLFAYSEVYYFAIVYVNVILTLGALFLINKKIDDEKIKSKIRPILLGFIVLALLPLYLFQYDLNWDLLDKKYELNETSYYNYHYLDDSKKCVEDYGILNFLIRDLEKQYIDSKDNSAEINEIDNYFANLVKHQDNELTGVFKDKNIIVINSAALDLKQINEKDTPNIWWTLASGITSGCFYNPTFYNENGDLDFMANLSIVPYGINKNTIYDCARNTFDTTLAKTFIENGYFTQYFFDDYDVYENRKNIVLDTYGYQEFYDCTKMGGEDNISCWQVCDQVAGMLSYYSSIGQKYFAYVNLYSNLDIDDLEIGLAKLYEAIVDCGLKEDCVIVLMSGYDKDIEPLFCILGCSDENHVWFNLGNKPFTSLDLLPTLANLWDFDCNNVLGEDIVDGDYPGFVFKVNNEIDDYWYIWYNSHTAYSANMREIVGTFYYIEVDEEQELAYFYNKAQMIRVSHLILDTDYFRVKD